MKRTMRMCLPAVVALCVVAGAAVAATPGDYEGWLYKKNGTRHKGTLSKLTVEPGGDRFRLSVYNMPLSCPYLDRNGDPARARFRFIQRGVIIDNAIDDTREYPSDSPTHVVRVRGSFVGRRFRGTIRVSSAPRVAGACTGSARIRVSR
jgi:hypothetical protein